MLDVRIDSLKRTRRGGPAIRFVLDTDFGGHVPTEHTLRQTAGETTARLATEGNPSHAVQWVRSIQGWAGVLLGWRDLDDAEEWFTTFATAFPDADGEIVGGPRYRMQTKTDPRAVLAGHLYLTTSDMRLLEPNDRGPFWGVDATTTRAACERLTQWVDQPDARIWVAPDPWVSFETTSLDHVESFTEMVLDNPSLHLDTALTKPLRYRTALVQHQGSLAVQAVDPTLDMADQLRLSIQVLRWFPAQSDYGYVRHAMGYTVPLDDGVTWPHYPDLNGAQIRANRPLLASFVPDVHGVQLLTDAHLERAHDLTSWDIVPLGNGRHLVMADDLGAWYQPIAGQPPRGIPSPTSLLPPDLDMVAQARADFGDMILTPELIKEHNPWR